MDRAGRDRRTACTCGSGCSSVSSGSVHTGKSSDSSSVGIDSGIDSGSDGTDGIGGIGKFSGIGGIGPEVRVLPCADFFFLLLNTKSGTATRTIQTTIHIISRKSIRFNAIVRGYPLPVHVKLSNYFQRITRIPSFFVENIPAVLPVLLQLRGKKGKVIELHLVPDFADERYADVKAVDILVEIEDVRFNGDGVS